MHQGYSLSETPAPPPCFSRHLCEPSTTTDKLGAFEQLCLTAQTPSLHSNEQASRGGFWPRRADGCNRCRQAGELGQGTRGGDQRRKHKHKDAPANRLMSPRKSCSQSQKCFGWGVGGGAQGESMTCITATMSTDGWMDGWIVSYGICLYLLNVSSVSF